jgi:hypothetical protein
MFKIRIQLMYLLSLLASSIITGQIVASECDNWEVKHSEWVWCDDFEIDIQLSSRYEDVNTNGFGRTEIDALEGIASLRQTYTVGQVNAGWIIKVKPDGYPEHIFYRWYHKFSEGYINFPPKMARAGYRMRSGSWQPTFMVHSWIAENNPTLNVLAKNSTQGPWLPVANSDFNLSQSTGKWNSYEVEIKLNTPGEADGIYRLWINYTLSIERTNVDLRGNTSDKINEVMLDTYWNGGATANLERFYDNFVISTQKIGPVKVPRPPTDVNML